MRSIRIIAVASHTPDWLRREEKQYQQQISIARLSIDTIKPAATIQKEAQALKAAIAATATTAKKVQCVLLDIGGRQVDSPQFAQRLRGWMDSNKPLVFVIGGANGVADSFLSQVDERLSLSPLTLPHAHARLLLVEQIFRADCHFRHHPYHR